MKSRKRTSFYNGTDYHCSVACVLNWTFMTISLLLVLKLLLVATPKECVMVLSKKKTICYSAWQAPNHIQQNFRIKILQSVSFCHTFFFTFIPFRMQSA